ncbi:cytochrome c oxidase assembly protein [Pacificimonas flava]|uniref:Cytochrome c oxidase assembly protein CtaG n=2 Tax=Pacificimonas TaxID=1960290 RepID=A0A219B2D8_9SPHN|nr:MULTISPECIES: cytochrome c oxidase assembly protein [Pacificimonas]MBZ6378066.1 cytochrome c oxidase assembly protein [Pacificimonas aurantium]OWV32293.1 cytochrome c oxidase assembly protein [Pacificimonas flava]
MTANKRTGFMMFGVAVLMLGMAYASVPLYRIFCQVTGFGGTTQRAEESAQVVATDVPVKVRFDANTAPGLGWDFEPVKNVDTILIGERKLAFYQATNNNPYPVTGVATFNVSPDTAGKYFNKIQCFCFNEQTLQPGQSVSMPVSYYIDPEFLDDPDAAKIEEVTLSYTFFPTREQTASKRAKSDTRG